MARTPRLESLTAGDRKWQRLGLTPGIRLAFRVLTAALIVLGVAAGGTRVSALVLRSVEEQQRFQVSLKSIELTPVPVWINTDLLAEVQHLSGLPTTINILEQDLVHRLRDAFALHPWVRRVKEVQVGPPNLARIRVAYREPVALVRTLHSFEPVDRNGVLLPADSLANLQLYLTISGVRSTPTGPAGTKWEDAAVLAGAATAHAVAAHHRNLGLTTIDVSYYRPTTRDSAQIYLLSEQGTRVKWGRSPDSGYPGEVPVLDKIDRLLRYAAEHGSLDLPAGPYEIDVTHWQEISRRPRLQVPPGQD